MKRLFLTLVLVFVSLVSYAQTYKFYQTQNYHNKLRLNTITGEVYQIQDDGQSFLVHPSTTPYNIYENRYILYETENMWTYILLDRFLGKLWQCQYSVKGPDYRGSWLINGVALSVSSTAKFTIEPLISMFQFYLINQENGDMWKFQWSTKGDDYRWIEKFN